MNIQTPHPSHEIEDDDKEDIEVIYEHGQPRAATVKSDTVSAGTPTNTPSRKGRGLRNRQFWIEDDEEELPPSKTKIKQQMHELQDLGAELVALGKDQLAQLDIPESLRDAIREMHRINKFGAQRRQMQYIGKLMRDIETEPIIAKLNTWKGVSRSHVAYTHLLERWRDRLLESDAALTELLAAYPGADVQRLRTLIRNAQKEKEAGKPPKNFRDIYQILRELIPAPE